MHDRTSRQQPLLTKGQGHSQLLQRLADAPVNVLPSQPACLAQRHLFQQGEHSGHRVLPLSPCLPTSSCCCRRCGCAWAGNVRAEQRHKELRKYTHNSSITRLRLLMRDYRTLLVGRVPLCLNRTAATTSQAWAAT